MDRRTNEWTDIGGCRVAFATENKSLENKDIEKYALMLDLNEALNFNMIYIKDIYLYKVE